MKGKKKKKKSTLPPSKKKKNFFVCVMGIIAIPVLNKQYNKLHINLV